MIVLSDLDLNHINNKLLMSNNFKTIKIFMSINWFLFILILLFSIFHVYRITTFPTQDEAEKALRVLIDKKCFHNKDFDINLILESDHWQALLKQAFNAGVDVDFKYFDENDHWITSLIYACISDNYQLASFLIANGANVNIESNIGSTPLTLAFRHGSKKIVKLLLQHGANLNYREKNGFTPLMLAISHHKNNIVKLLIKKGADIYERNTDGNMALNYAAQKNNEEAIKILIKNGLKLKDEVHALSCAITMGHCSMVNFFITEGIHLNAKDDYGRTPLDIAIFMLSKKFVESLYSKCSIEIAHKTSDQLRVEIKKIIGLLLENGAIPNVKNNFNIGFAMLDDKELAEVLLKHKADPNMIVDEKYNHPILTAAVSRDNKELVMLLLEYGADVNRRSSDLVTALFYAKSKAIVELLIKKGIDVDAKDFEGYTALNLAIYMNKEEIIEPLILNGADVNVIGADGYSPLARATMHCSQNVVDLLIKNNAKYRVISEKPFDKNCPFNNDGWA